MKSFEIETKFNYGKYKGLSVQQVAEIDSKYLHHQLLKNEYFYLSKQTMNEIEKVANKTVFTPYSLMASNRKLEKWSKETIDNFKNFDGIKLDYQFVIHSSFDRNGELKQLLNELKIPFTLIDNDSSTKEYYVTIGTEVEFEMIFVITFFLKFTFRHHQTEIYFFKSPNKIEKENKIIFTTGHLNSDICFGPVEAERILILRNTNKSDIHQMYMDLKLQG